MGGKAFSDNGERMQSLPCLVRGFGRPQSVRDNGDRPSTLLPLTVSSANRSLTSVLGVCIPSSDAAISEAA